MSRRKPELQAIDVNAWPTVANTEFEEPVRRMFQARRQAILRYVAGEPIRAIEKSTNFNRRQLYRGLERAQTVHADGRPFGFRALIHYVRIADYARCVMCSCAVSTAAAVRLVRSLSCLNASRR
ncbi:hypothetical protein LJ656_33540 [Paraburkholderia sp. MMS20-SJTR3]|uniref:Helix-turn-helix domain-containing protein n=1 Tax=Paraburkholderia sejongensis TaxID=2886946 RepID=A0ABS8K5N6_9BURK|nr:hypothetical protein [Paraburkholderia sp. MMS20-SJTR3]MCC8397484.1 hypothetical protein [Paraburkholderia sp. MMS20-SJTR3]